MRGITAIGGTRTETITTGSRIGTSGPISTGSTKATMIANLVVTDRASTDVLTQVAIRLLRAGRLRSQFPRSRLVRARLPRISIC